MKTHLTAIIAAVMLVCGITTVSGNTRKTLPGVFSVGEDRYVRFSPGNLQYNGTLVIEHGGKRYSAIGTELP